MTGNELADRTWDDILDKVEGIAGSATKSQVQSLMAVPAKATLEIGQDLRNATEQVRRFNESTGRLTIVLIVLNAVLAAAAVIEVIVALAAAH